LKQSFSALPSIRLSALTALTVAVLAACGGGSGSSDSASTGGSNPNAANWTSETTARKRRAHPLSNFHLVMLCWSNVSAH